MLLSFFDGTRLLRGLDQGQTCILTYDLVQATEGQRLSDAWVRLVVPPGPPATKQGPCDSVGTWGSTPVDWVASNPIEVGVGPMDKETLEHLESLWTFYESDWNASFDEIQSDLVAGVLFIDGEVNDQWAFGAAYKLNAQGMKIQVDGKDVRIAPEQIAAGTSVNRAIRLFGRKPLKISVPASSK